MQKLKLLNSSCTSLSVLMLMNTTVSSTIANRMTSMTIVKTVSLLMLLTLDVMASSKDGIRSRMPVKRGRDAESDHESGDDSYDDRRDVKVFDRLGVPLFRVFLCEFFYCIHTYSSLPVTNNESTVPSGAAAIATEPRIGVESSVMPVNVCFTQYMVQVLFELLMTGFWLS